VAEGRALGAKLVVEGIHLRVVLLADVAGPGPDEVAGHFACRRGGELVAAGFVVDPVRGRRRCLGEHGPVGICDEVALGHPAVALDGLEHFPGGASH
jgi:hypothetical protein